MEKYGQRLHLDYPELTMFQMVERIARQYPREPAYEFYGRKTSYQGFVQRIERAARAFVAMGIGKGDVVTLCMPNAPQTLDCFYALDRIGAVANMVHPLSARDEIAFYLNLSKSKMILTLDLFYKKVEEALKQVDRPVTVLVARMQEELPPHLAAAYTLKKGKDYLKYPDRDNALLWRNFLKKGDRQIALPDIEFERERTSVILYSGGTSGKPKGICLSDYNMNACAVEAREVIGEEFRTGIKMLSCMPCFHGFGLGINLHTVLTHGACCILMPTFTSKDYARMLIKKKPNFIAGVPTIFKVLLRMPELENVDLSFLMGVFCGGDSLSVDTKKELDAFLKTHGAHIQVREGYGLTECVTASCLTPKHEYKEGSIGIPFPDTTYQIVRPGTDDVVPTGEEGEIILTGPTVMLGYLDAPEETAAALRKLPDGKTWLYTGDLGYMDADGFLYYRQRMGRLIIINGYNIYPSEVENILDSSPDVFYSCIVPVRKPGKGDHIRAYIVLKEGVAPDEACKVRIMKYLAGKVAHYALPKELEFREELPKTLVGKVAYRLLEEEANSPAREGEG